MKIAVTVCLCTFRRKTIATTLDSLAEQSLPADVTMNVVVVDSDLNGSARPIVEQAQSRLALSIRYFVAERRGVAEARNKAVDNATGEWLAFIDDDEVPASDWIAALLDCAIRTGAQVVFGDVVTLYPDGCPDWIKEGNLFGKPLPVTGTRVKVGATCNALISRNVLLREKHVFDVAYGTTGGEDTELFHRLSKNGALMIACREALVTETVEVQRLNREFLLQKALRIGETHYRIFIAEEKIVAFCVLLTKAFILSGVAIAIATVLCPFGQSWSMKYQIKAASNIGKLRAAFGIAAVELYKH